jgi:hypothetical protein
MSTILSLKRTIFFALLSCGFAQMSNAVVIIPLEWGMSLNHLQKLEFPLPRDFDGNWSFGFAGKKIKMWKIDGKTNEKTDISDQWFEIRFLSQDTLSMYSSLTEREREWAPKFGMLTCSKDDIPDKRLSQVCVTSWSLRPRGNRH